MKMTSEWTFLQNLLGFILKRERQTCLPTVLSVRTKKLAVRKD